MNLYDKGDVPASKLIADWCEMGLEIATRTGVVAAALHATCYVCDRAVEERRLTPGEVLGDQGLLHGLIHAAAGDVSVNVVALGEHVRALEEALA